MLPGGTDCPKANSDAHAHKTMREKYRMSCEMRTSGLGELHHFLPDTGFNAYAVAFWGKATSCRQASLVGTDRVWETATLAQSDSE